MVIPSFGAGSKQNTADMTRCSSSSKSNGALKWLSACGTSKFGLVGLAESLALEVREYEYIIVLTIFLEEVATKMCQEYHFSYY
jgi:NAD(P)-dependent dehydrogenase (short-subunit alcohol dehydrogenase family)